MTTFDRPPSGSFARAVRIFRSVESRFLRRCSNPAIVPPRLAATLCRMADTSGSCAAARFMRSSASRSRSASVGAVAAGGAASTALAGGGGVVVCCPVPPEQTSRAARTERKAAFRRRIRARIAHLEPGKRQPCVAHWRPFSQGADRNEAGEDPHPAVRGGRYRGHVPALPRGGRHEALGRSHGAGGQGVHADRWLRARV